VKAGQTSDGQVTGRICHTNKNLISSSGVSDLHRNHSLLARLPIVEPVAEMAGVGGATLHVHLQHVILHGAVGAARVAAAICLTGQQSFLSRTVRSRMRLQM
jgi:hypothetical protein